MKQQTIFLKIVLIIMALGGSVFWIYGLPWYALKLTSEFPLYLSYPVVGAIYLTGIPFMYILFQGFKLLNNIDKSEAFSEKSVDSLKKIKYGASIISLIYIISIVFFYFISRLDGESAILLAGGIMIFAAVVIGVFAAVLEKLLKQAIEIKSENDLTI